MVKEVDFTHCPHCGHTVHRQGPNVLICTSCNLHYYVNPKPTNGIILGNEKDEVLFVVRAIEPKKGMLDLPGGFIDSNETLEASMEREAREELGIDLPEFTYVSSFADEYEYGGVSSRTLCMLFYGEIPSDTLIKTGDDAAGYQWIKKSEIPYEKIAFAGMKTALKKYITRLTH